MPSEFPGGVQAVRCRIGAAEDASWFQTNEVLCSRHLQQRRFQFKRVESCDDQGSAVPYQCEGAASSARPADSDAQMGQHVLNYDTFTEPPAEVGSRVDVWRDAEEGLRCSARGAHEVNSELCARLCPRIDPEHRRQRLCYRVSTVSNDRRGGLQHRLLVADVNAERAEDGSLLS